MKNIHIFTNVNLILLRKKKILLKRDILNVYHAYGNDQSFSEFCENSFSKN